MNKIITASIVLYKNDKIILLSAINSFLNTNLDIELYLIDNSPNDNLRNVVNDKRVFYIHNPTNPGFGAGHNIALRLSLTSMSKFHLVLNPDVYFSPGTLEEIVDYMDANPNIGNLMPKVIYPDKTLQYLCKLLPTPYDWIGRRFNPIKSVVKKRNIHNNTHTWFLISPRTIFNRHVSSWISCYGC